MAAASSILLLSHPWPPAPLAPIPPSQRRKLHTSVHCSGDSSKSSGSGTWMLTQEHTPFLLQPFTSEVLVALVVGFATQHSCRLLLSKASLCCSSSWTACSPFASLALLPAQKTNVLESLRWTTRQLTYMLDVLLEKHPISYLYILAITCALFVTLGGVCFHRFRTFEQKTGDSFWDAWACLCSSGTHLRERTFHERVIGIFLAVCGLMFYSLLTSTLTAQFRLRMEILREGANIPVMEAGHTVICGTNHHLRILLSQLNKSYELALKNGTAPSRNKTVVVLSERPKKEVDNSLHGLHEECKALNILTRSGKLGSGQSFHTVGAARASQVILLSRKKDAYYADADVVLSVLSLRPMLEAHPKELIVEVTKSSTAELLESLAGQKVTALQDLGSKLLVQCSRQQGLYDVYEELLDHGRNAMNLTNQPKLAGLSYRQVRRGFTEGVVCGILRDQVINFHPKDSLVLRKSDMLIVIAAKKKLDEGLSGLSSANTGSGSFDANSVTKRTSKPLSKTAESSAPRKESIIVLGWKPSVKEMILEYDEYVGKGSELMILEREPLDSKELQMPLRNLKVLQKEGNPLSETDLKKSILEMWSKKKNDPLTLIAISDWKYEKQRSSEKSDKQTIYALLLAESLCKQLDVKVGSLVGELIDARLGKQAMSSHNQFTFIGTSELIGLVTAKVAENSELNGVWTELLNSWGNEIYVKDISLYIKEGELVTFEELSDRAVLRDEVAIGYRMDKKIVINPNPKAAPLTFKRGDSLVVICEYEYQEMP